jgi:hypothetical protein
LEPHGYVLFTVLRLRSHAPLRDTSTQYLRVCEVDLRTARNCSTVKHLLCDDLYNVNYCALHERTLLQLLCGRCTGRYCSTELLTTTVYAEQATPTVTYGTLQIL